MIISGTGIITPFTAKVKTDFVPVTTYDFQNHFEQASSGNWYASDRGSAMDYYDAENVRLYGKETVINNFIAQVEANRVAGSNVLTLSSFSETEHIFGADVDYSGGTYPVLATVTEIGRREQGTWKGWGLPLKMRLLPPFAFVGSSALPTLRHVSVGIDADADRTLLKQDSYGGQFFYADQQADAGVFTGTFIFYDAEMIALRRFMATNRAASFALPTIYGVQYPFGRRPLPALGYYTACIKSIEDEAMFGISRWTCKITFLEQPN
jgi:hypothetical protein